MRNSVIHVRVSDNLKASVDQILGDLGLTLSYAVNVYLKQIELKKGIPFPIELSDTFSEDELVSFASSINAMGGKEPSMYAKKILHLYAKNQIDRETAMIALQAEHQ
jgi:DNA-damage-inducible protein J